MQIKSSNPFFDDYVLVEYEFTTLCNKNCSYCYNMVDHEVRFTNDLETILSDITSILTVDNPRIIFNLIGGEVLVHPHFETIIEHIHKIKKPETRVLMYTHGDHKPEWFKKKIDHMKKFGDKFKIHCTIHFEELNYHQFKQNLQYMHDNFSAVTLYVLVDDILIRNFDFIQELLDSCPNLKLFGLPYDDKRGIDLMRQLIKFKELNRWSDRMDNTFTLKEGKFPQSTKLFDIYKSSKDFNFYGSKCTLMIYLIDKDGNIRKACDTVILGNIRDNKKDMFNFKTITCPNTRCMESLSNLDITD